MDRKLKEELTDKKDFYLFIFNCFVTNYYSNNCKFTYIFVYNNNFTNKLK